MKIIFLLFFVLIAFTLTLGCVYYSIVFFIDIKNILKRRKPIIENDLSLFVKDNIQRKNGSFTTVKSVYERYLKYTEKIGEEPMTRVKFSRYFRRGCKYIQMVQKRSDFLPELYFTNILLKPNKEESNA
ncbi:hypothetical protein [Treponema sp. R80B11-R83G3]